MYYLGVCYCPRRCVAKWIHWAFCWRGRPSNTYLYDIESRRFLRVMGVEIKLMWWKPKPMRAELPADLHTVYLDKSGQAWMMKRVDGSRPLIELIEDPCAIPVVSLP